MSGVKGEKNAKKRAKAKIEEAKRAASKDLDPAFDEAVDEAVNPAVDEDPKAPSLAEALAPTGTLELGPEPTIEIETLSEFPPEHPRIRLKRPCRLYRRDHSFLELFRGQSFEGALASEICDIVAKTYSKPEDWYEVE